MLQWIIFIVAGGFSLISWRKDKDKSLLYLAILSAMALLVKLYDYLAISVFNFPIEFKLANSALLLIFWIAFILLVLKITFFRKKKKDS